MTESNMLSAELRREVIEKVADTLDRYYVFPELGKGMSEALMSSLSSGEYDDLSDAEAFCKRLTDDLQGISRDKHLRVRYNEEARPISSPDDDFPPELLEAWIAEARTQNFGFYKAERLPGNVGLLDLRSFWEAGWPGVGEVAVGAMNMLAHTDALIIDLRRNGGGSPGMVALLTSFLVSPEPVHLNSFYERSGDAMRQSWTLPYVPGPRTPDKPIYVLTGSYTFSAAEEFTYNLKNMKRATIVGESTGGGAHPGGDFSVTPHFRVFVPSGRPINPISGTNWEGTGVEPDVAVPQEEALETAYQLALKDVLAKLGDAPTGAAKVLAEEVKEASKKRKPKKAKSKST